MIYRSVQLAGYDYAWLWVVAAIGAAVALTAALITHGITRTDKAPTVVLSIGLFLTGVAMIPSAVIASDKAQTWDHNQRVGALEKLGFHYVTVIDNSFTAEGNDAIYMAGEFIQLPDADPKPNQWHIVLVRGAGPAGGQPDA